METVAFSSDALYCYRWPDEPEETVHFADDAPELKRRINSEWVLPILSKNPAAHERWENLIGDRKNPRHFGELGGSDVLPTGALYELEGQQVEFVEGKGTGRKFGAAVERLEDPGPLPDELKKNLLENLVRSRLDIGTGALDGCLLDHEKVGITLPKEVSELDQKSENPMRGWQGRFYFRPDCDMAGLENWEGQGHVKTNSEGFVVVSNSRAYLRLLEAGLPLTSYSGISKTKKEEKV